MSSVAQQQPQAKQQPQQQKHFPVQKGKQQFAQQSKEVSRMACELCNFLRDNTVDRELLHRSNFVLLETSAHLFCKQEEMLLDICNAFPESENSLRIAWDLYEGTHRLLFKELNEIREHPQTVSGDVQGSITKIFRRLKEGGMHKLLKSCCKASNGWLEAVEKAEYVKVLDSISGKREHHQGVTSPIEKQQGIQQGQQSMTDKKQEEKFAGLTTQEKMQQHQTQKGSGEKQSHTK